MQIFKGINRKKRCKTGNSNIVFLWKCTQYLILSFQQLLLETLSILHSEIYTRLCILLSVVTQFGKPFQSKGTGQWAGERNWPSRPGPGHQGLCPWERQGQAPLWGRGGRGGERRASRQGHGSWPGAQATEGALVIGGAPCSQTTPCGRFPVAGPKTPAVGTCYPLGRSSHVRAVGQFLASVRVASP